MREALNKAGFLCGMDGVICRGCRIGERDVMPATGSLIASIGIATGKRACLR